MRIFNLFQAFLLLLVVMTFSQKAHSHPWGGLVIDAKGNLYFTFICPFVDDDHYACVWKIDSNQELSEVLKSRRSPSDIVLSRNPDRVIFAAERNGFHPNFRNTLWVIEDSDTSVLIPSNTNQEAFFIQAYTVSNDGTIFFAKENSIYRRDSTNTIVEIELGKDLGRINLLEITPDGSLYIMTNSDLYIKKGDELAILATNLKDDNPDNLPFRGANIFFDMAVDESKNVYLAYYGNREIIRVSPSGEIETFLESQAPWSPHGVDVLDGDVYLLESTIGNGKWWKFWERNDDVIIPRVRKVDNNGNVSVVFSYEGG